MPPSPIPSSHPTRAEEATVVPNVLGPEGPLYMDGNLYFVGWVSDTLSKWDGKKLTVLNHTPGCNHNGLALSTRRTFILACTAEKGAILDGANARRRSGERYSSLRIR